MRSSFRSLFFGLATLLSAGAMAQYPYYIALSGTVGSCYSGQVLTVQTVQGTLPQQSYTVTVNSNCTYSITVPVSNQPAWLEVTTACGGAFQVGSDSSQFNFIGDTAYSVIDLNCGGGGTYDCLNILNGPDLPGTPCDDGDPGTINDTWSANCACMGANILPCNADFWVLQAVTYDSLNQTTTPIPYELWIWNLSSGGSGTYTTFWSFGDGSSSTAQFPTHTYAGNGPYLLCLTIDDGMGCTSTHCDSVSIDSNGLYTGIMGGGNDRQNGFTINVQGYQTTGLNEQSMLDGIAAWPNPVANELNIALNNAVSGSADVTVLDMEGRVVHAERRMLANGRNQLLLQTSTLSPGLYTVRISNGAASISQRFVKVN